MRCPACGSGKTLAGATWRRQVRWIDGAGWRVHVCSECGHRFLSVQRVPSDDEIRSAIGEAV